jgi:acetoacetyl-CoA synthetase
MGKLLWQPSDEEIGRANITRFIELVNEEYRLNIDPYARGSYFKLYNWSIENVQSFWDALWKFVGIKASRMYAEVVDDLNKFPGARWFIGARLNFAENLLRYRDDRPALILKRETGTSTKITYADLYKSVARLANSLRKIGVSPGDRVCAYMPNTIETCIAMLATASIGAIWSSCGTELGAWAVIDRLAQIEPKVLFVIDRYQYKGNIFNMLSNIEKIAKGLSSLKKIIVVSYDQEKVDINTIPNSTYYDDFLSPEKQEIRFEHVPSDHPIYIMFSSGTTGKPKCIVQSCSGILINHLKELIIHTDLKREDKILYITSPSWMMWNWLMSSLAVGATIVLYDGSPNYPDWGDHVENHPRRESNDLRV